MLDTASPREMIRVNEVMANSPTKTLVQRPSLRPVTTPSETKVMLVVREGLRRGEVFALPPGDVILGRAPDIDICLEDRGVSRRHAQITVDASGAVEVRDLGSRNGTFVNREHIHRGSLQAGDKLLLGLEAVLELVPEHEKPVQTPVPAVANAAGAAMTPTGATAGRSTASMENYRQRLTACHTQMGTSHKFVADLQEKIGIALQADGYLEHARKSLEHAFSIQQSRVPPAPRATARVLSRLAQCELALDQPHVAMAHLELADQLLRTTLASPAEIGAVRLLLSQLLWRLNIDIPRSRVLARLARDVLANGGDCCRQLHHGADAWIRSIMPTIVESVP